MGGGADMSEEPVIRYRRGVEFELTFFNVDPEVLVLICGLDWVGDLDPPWIVRGDQ